MVYSVIGETFASARVEHKCTDPVEALQTALDLSNMHNMDWVIVLQDGLPIVKYVDGVISK